MDFNKLCCMCHERLYIKKQKFCCFGGGVQRMLYTYDCNHVIHSDCVNLSTPCPVCDAEAFSPEERELLHTPDIKIKHREYINSMSLERATVIFKVALEREKMCLVEEFLLHFLCTLQNNIREIKIIMTLTNSQNWS